MFIPKLTSFFLYFSIKYILLCSATSTNSTVKTWPLFPDPPRLEKTELLRPSGTSLNTFQLECSASYPVYFDFTPKKGTTFKTISRVNSTESHYNEALIISYPNSYSLYVDVFNGKLGNFTCRSGLDRNIATSVYVQINVTASGLFEKNSGPFHSELVEDEFWTIPCVAQINRFDNITLYREVTEENKTNSIESEDKIETTTKSASLSQQRKTKPYSRYDYDYETEVTPLYRQNLLRQQYFFSETSYTKYDPKYGFLLSKLEYSRPQGTYKCIGQLGNKTDSFVVDLKHFNVIPDAPRVTYRNNDTFQVTCESDEEIRIEYSNTTLLKEISSVHSSSKFFKYSLTYTFKEETRSSVILTAFNISYMPATFNLIAGEVNCIAVNSSKVLHTWQHDGTKICSCQRTSYYGISGKGITGEANLYSSQEFLTCSGQHYSRYYSTALISYVDTESKFKSEILQENKNKLYFDAMHKSTLNTYAYYSYEKKSYASSLVSCQIGQYKSLINAVATSSGYYANPTYLNASREIKVYIKDEDKGDYFQGDGIQISCVASRYLFYAGFKWVFNYKNGTVLSAEQEMKIGSVKRIPANAGYGITDYKEWAHVERIEIQLPQNLVSVSCTAVLWNSTESVTSNITLDKYTVSGGPTQYFDRPLRCNLTSQKNQTLKHRKPEIIMDRTKGVFSYYSILSRLKLNPVTDLNITLPSSIFAVDLHCLSDYPTEWTFQGDDIPYTTNQIGPASFEATAGQNYLLPCFKSTISVNISSFSATGEYKCRIRSSSISIQSSVYIFSNGPSSSTSQYGQSVTISPARRLLNAGEHLFVEINDNSPTTTLPCRVTHPDSIVSLYFHEPHGSNRLLLQPEILSYDPRKGFVMDTSELKQSAIYICALGNSTSPQNSVTLSFVVAPTNSSTNGDSTLNKAIFRIDNWLENVGGASAKMDIILILFMIITLVGLMTIGWFIRKQPQNLRSKDVGCYIKLDSSL